MSLMSSKQTRIFQNTDPVMTNSATLVDIEPEVVQAMLEYIYKGTISGLNRVSQLIALLKEGIKYGIEGLKRQCLVQMLELMDVDNALEISSIVEAHGPEEGDILDFVLKFIDRYLSTMETSVNHCYECFLMKHLTECATALKTEIKMALKPCAALLFLSPKFIQSKVKKKHAFPGKNKWIRHGRDERSENKMATIFETNGKNSNQNE